LVDMVFLFFMCFHIYIHNCEVSQQMGCRYPLNFAGLELPPDY